MTIVPLTTLSGDEYSPAFSPDGEQIAFSWNGENEDNFDLYIKLVGSAAVTTDDPSGLRCGPELVAGWQADRVHTVEDGGGCRFTCSLLGDRSRSSASLP
jgi:hypothetical protein